MTTEDFIFILIEAFAHQDPIEFFKARQKLWYKNERYSRDGFNEGLLKTFKWLNHQVHLPDRHRGRLKLPDGQIKDEYIENDVQLRELKSKGELSFPEQNFILVCRNTDQKAILVLNDQTLEALWMHLFNYLNPYCKEFLPPPPKPEDENLLYNGYVERIIVPEVIFRYFEPIDGDDSELNGENSAAASAASLLFTN